MDHSVRHDGGTLARLGGWHGGGVAPRHASTRHALRLHGDDRSSEGSAIGYIVPLDGFDVVDQLEMPCQLCPQLLGADLLILALFLFPEHTC